MRIAVLSDIHGNAHALRRCLDGVDRLVHLAAAVGVGQSMYEIVRYTSINALGAAVVAFSTIRQKDFAHNRPQ